MRIAVMGSGGVGGYFGARLAQGGCEVAFVARGAHGAAMRSRGLRVTSALGELHLPSPFVTEDPREIGRADLVLFGVKLWDTETAAHAIRPLVGPDTAVISFQNGVVKDELLRAILGEPAVAGGTAYIATTIAEPGVIAHTGTLQRLVFGEYDGRRSERLQRFHAACLRAGIDAQLHEDIARTVWEKFVFLVGLSGATAATRATIGAVRAHPAARRLLAGLMQEALQVGRAEGVALAPDFAEDRLRFCDTLPEGMTSSMHHDLQRGHRLELEWLSGDVCRRGERLGVPTPVNRTVSDVLALHANGAAVR